MNPENAVQRAKEASHKGPHAQHESLPNKGERGICRERKMKEWVKGIASELTGML